MKKIDLKKELSGLYAPSAKKPEMVEVPVLNFLRIDGKGNPNTSEAYKDAVEALFTVSYTLKFMIKKGPEAIDYGVMPLEGLWWIEDMANFDADKKDDWLWTMMIMQPAFISQSHVGKAIEAAKAKKGLPSLDKIRFEPFTEGLAGQVLHIGPFSEEGPTIQGLHHFIHEQGYALRGKHHEIYLSDIRRAAPEKWRTIVRQPAG
ncbi:MAG TPA: GyrI-like domain-containing protein [Flavilitoribacter sp.]|nr:GyrI-like domain-containing protein [Flavilitoribacter sp.]HMQ90383.1 GyrI-like domain-containing protein [Flavilitoribacter sp.]